MSNERILIVEDERIVAEDLRDMLQRLEYQVLDIASSGEEAVRKAEDLHPDLVLMDIRLSGSMDGIEAAEMIWTHQEIPVTYLTAYADEPTLERAKATLPFGYILKPFEERDLRSTIEIALYKHRMDATLKKMDGWYASALDSLSDAVIATNAQGGIIFMNPAAETLTGWTLRQVYGKPFSGTFGFSNTLSSESPTMLKTREGHEVPVECRLNSLKDDHNQFTGTVVTLHPSRNRENVRSHS